MMVIRAFLLFQGSRLGLFYDVSEGESRPLRIPPINRRLRLPPLISREKHSGLPPVTTEKTSCPPDIANYLMLSVVSTNIV
ncbi:MAG: hypothetical protein DRG66_02865 [Deltaproteobacteria bacterium]|nr:MAG: hypothetical protein DRG66_02865 [Deltaproteobacteria bacterium]